MKVITRLGAIVLVMLVAGCNMAQINEDLAQDNRDLSYKIGDDQDLMAEWLDATMKGDTSWNADEDGNPIWEAERDSMALTSMAAKLAADELLANAKESNKDK